MIMGDFTLPLSVSVLAGRYFLTICLSIPQFPSQQSRSQYQDLLSAEDVSMPMKSLHCPLWTHSCRNIPKETFSVKACPQGGTY